MKIPRKDLATIGTDISLWFRVQPRKSKPGACGKCRFATKTVASLAGSMFHTSITSWFHHCCRMSDHTYYLSGPLATFSRFRSFKTSICTFHNSVPSWPPASKRLRCSHNATRHRQCTSPADVCFNRTKRLFWFLVLKVLHNKPVKVWAVITRSLVCNVTVHLSSLVKG